MSSDNRTAYNQYNKCMKELLENPPELEPCRRENMLFQERITKSIECLCMIALEFSELGNHHPFTENVRIILQQANDMMITHRHIKSRMIYDETEEEVCQLESDMSYDIRYNGLETYIPKIQYGYIN